MVKKINHTRAENTSHFPVFPAKGFFTRTNYKQTKRIFPWKLKDSNQQTQIHEFRKKDKKISIKPIVFVLDWIHELIYQGGFEETNRMVKDWFKEKLIDKGKQPSPLVNLSTLSLQLKINRTKAQKQLCMNGNTTIF